MTEKTYAEWDHKEGRYIMTTGVKVQLPKSTKVEDGKISKKPGLMAGAKRRKAERLVKAWRRRSK
jgi:hypothetical protein